MKATPDVEVSTIVPESPSTGVAGEATAKTTTGAPGALGGEVQMQNLLGAMHSIYYFCVTDRLMDGNLADMPMDGDGIDLDSPSSDSHTAATARTRTLTATVRSLHDTPNPTVADHADQAGPHEIRRRGAHQPLDRSGGRESSGAAMAPPLTPSSPAMRKEVLAIMTAEQYHEKLALQQRNVYMSGLPVTLRPSTFRAMCSVFGRIESSKLCMEVEDSTRCRGFGFVLFDDVASANACIAALHEKTMEGRTLQVRRADFSAAPQPLSLMTRHHRTGSGPLPFQATTKPPMAAAAGTRIAPKTSSFLALETSGLALTSVRVAPPQPSPLATPAASSVDLSAAPVKVERSAATSVPTSSSLPFTNTVAPLPESFGAASPAATMSCEPNSAFFSCDSNGSPLLHLYSAAPPGALPSVVPQPLLTTSHASLGGRGMYGPHPATLVNHLRPPLSLLCVSPQPSLPPHGSHFQTQSLPLPCTPSPASLPPQQLHTLSQRGNSFVLTAANEPASFLSQHHISYAKNISVYPTTGGTLQPYGTAAAAAALPGAQWRAPSNACSVNGQNILHEYAISTAPRTATMPSTFHCAAP